MIILKSKRNENFWGTGYGGWGMGVVKKTPGVCRKNVGSFEQKLWEFGFQTRGVFCRNLGSFFANKRAKIFGSNKPYQ
jgi:hypothetical protein